MTPWTAARQASLSFTTSWSWLRFMSTESMMPSYLILCHPILLSPSIFPSIRVFSNESAIHVRWPEYWNFSFSISPSNEYSELISPRIDWFDLLAVQGTLKSLLQCHNLKTSVLWRSAFFMVQLSHLYVTTAKTTALTRWTFVSKVMPLTFYMVKINTTWSIVGKKKEGQSTMEAKRSTSQSEASAILRSRQTMCRGLWVETCWVSRMFLELRDCVLGNTPKSLSTLCLSVPKIYLLHFQGEFLS